jgi:nitrate/nitrite transport system ATP-binding protein
MITNDVDEAIILADRIVPLSAGPGATLGDPVTVSVARPRDRKKLNFDEDYRRDRKVVLHYLLTHSPRDMKRPPPMVGVPVHETKTELETVPA